VIAHGPGTGETEKRHRRAIASRATAVGALGAILLLSLLVGWLSVYTSALRVLLAVSLCILVIGLSVRSPRHLIYGLIVWLAALGLIRRLVSTISPAGPLDPLLVVAPVAVATLIVAAKEDGAFRNLSPFSKVMGVFCLLILLASLNPLQGGLTVGMGGLLFMLVPVACFWVGRAFCTDQVLKCLLKLVGVLAVGAALYGLFQTLLRFPSWDQAWLQTSGYTALSVNGVIRPFGTFSSAAEYAYFLAIAIVVWTGFGFKRGYRTGVSIVVATLAVAMFYESSRGVLVALVAALGFAVGIRLRLPMAAAAVTGAALLVGLVSVAGHFSAANLGTGVTASLAAHQIQGLADPLNAQTSTLGVHLSELTTGLESVVHSPMGLGTGTVSLAATKFGGVAAGTEVDPSNAAVALGAPGLIVYLVIVGMAFVKAYRLALARRDALSVVAVCILVVSFLQWLNGGQYAVVFLPWLILGWLDRTRPSSKNPVEVSGPTGAAPASDWLEAGDPAKSRSSR